MKKTLILSILILFVTFTSFTQTAKMILVEGGTFSMGNATGDFDEKPVHKVTVSSFYICEHEVTVMEYKKFVTATGNKMPPAPNEDWIEEHPDTKKFYTSPTKKWWGWKPNYPIHKVNWYNATEYCNWLSEKEGLEKCYSKNADGGWDCDFSKKGYRLPTEAEWEFAAKGGNKSKGFKYSGSNNIKEIAWYDETTFLSGPKNVKSKKANELGIYDMSGNVWEWCSDYYTKTYYSHTANAKNPFNSRSQPYRVLRGGAWHYQGNYATSTSRDGPEAVFCNYNYGFRVAKSK